MLQLENRDMRCAADVGRMAALGRFDTEFQMYGCAYLQNGKVTYRVSPNATQIYQFTAQSVHEGLYPTSMVVYTHRTSVPSGLQEQIANETKLQLVRNLHQTYPHCFFELLEPLCQTSPGNSSLPLLQDMADIIDGRFNDLELQLLEGTTQLAYEAKLLNDCGYYQIHKFLKKTRHQMEEDSIIQDNFCRTLYGFCYQEANGTIKCTFDAQQVTIYERHLTQEMTGYLTGPILQKTYWFKNFDVMSNIRHSFQNLLLSLQSQTYFEFLNKIKTLPSVIDIVLFQQTLQYLATAHVPQATADFLHYGRRWNVRLAETKNEA